MRVGRLRRALQVKAVLLPYFGPKVRLRWAAWFVAGLKEAVEANEARPLARLAARCRHPLYREALWSIHREMAERRPLAAAFVPYAFLLGGGLAADLAILEKTGNPDVLGRHLKLITAPGRAGRLL